MSKKITLENVDSSELPEVPVIGEVKQIRFTQDMELVSTLADSDLFMIQAGADLEARPNTITFDLIIKNLSGPIEEGSEKFVTGDMMFKVIGDMNLLDTWDNTNLVSSLNATFVNVRRIEEELRREINRSTGKDDLHDTQIANLRQDLTSTNEMLNQEINRSVAKDKEHDELLEGLRDDVDSTSSKLDAEINRSTTKDAEHDTLLKGLRVDVNANKSAIDSEVARSTARDEAHDAAISKNASDIATESSRAKAEEAKIRQEMQSADTNLQNAITAETERATGVEEDLQRQITDLSGSTDDRLEALEALSHEQNTDTGTTSKTFVIDSGNTGAMLKAEGGGLSTRTKGDAGYANFTVQNLVIKGDVTQEGDTFITQAERVEVRDNMILINEGETGAGVTAGFAGIEVDRGTEQNFMFGFNESDGMFKIGKEGNMFDVALRQPVGDMIDGMFASWDAATKTFKTTNLIPYNKSLDFKFDPEIADATLKMKFMEAGLALSMSGDDSILALLPGIPQDEVKYSLISTNTNGIILGDSSGSNDKFILDIKKPSFISPVLDKNVIIGGKNAYFSYYSHLAGSPNTIIASCGVEAPSFYRASDNAEVLYSLDQARLTDGMFLSWDAANKMVVTTNVIPPTLQLYFKDNNTSIKYSTANNGSLAFMTMGKGWRVFTNDTFTQFSSDANKFYFIGDINVSTGNIYTNLTGLRLSAKTASVMIRDGGSVLNTPLTSTTYYRSSDDSEVLYQADLKSVLTGKETNYAPTVKAVSDAIDSVNTGTTESLKGYLKLSGGTMTGSIRIVDSGNSDVLQGIYNNDGTKALLFTYLKGSESRWGVGSKDLVGIIRSNVSDLIHLVNNNNTLTEYPIYDKRNLPDPATKSGNNAFTGTNSFVANKFSVGNFRVDSDSNLGVNTPYREGLEGLSRSLYFKYNDLEDTKVSFGSVSSSTVANYAYIGIGSVRLDNAQYKFRTESLDLNTIFRIDFGDASAISAGESTIIFGSDRRGCYVRSNDTDLVHIKNSNSYKIWDASNLPTPASTSDIPDVSDMAKKSEANTFTAQNTFTAGQFNVGPFEVSSTGQLLVNITTSGGWERSITFKANSDNATSIRIGGHGIGSTSNFAWIGVGDVEYDTAQYRFYGTSMKVPSVWSLDDADGNSLIWTQSTQLAHIGRATGTTKIRSGAVDLIHTKGATDYKILDESNYSQYLPTNNKWTYGFVNTYIEGSNADFNTLFAGPDSPKILFNYYRPIGNNTNAPTGMSYGAVLQIDGNYNSAYNNVVLRPQLAFDINHNVENGTRYMWFRTANNLGYGDSSNWKRVVTADENVAVLVMDANTYPSIARIDGTTYNWLRTPAQGLLPNTQATLDSGGTSYLGTNDWSFGYASIHTIYSKRYMFGNTGVDFRLDTNNKIAATISGSARGIEIGDLLVSSNYGEDAAKVPTNGIFASGIIKSYSGFSSSSRINNLNISKASNDALLISSFAGENVINKPGVDPVSGQSVGDGVALTYFWDGDYAFQLVGDIDGTGMAYRKYTPSTGNSTDWKFLADTKWVNTKLGGYLPLTGGILSGQLIINSISNSLILNNTNSSETESFIKVQLNGTSKAAIGFLSSIGSYIYNYESNKYLFVGTDGAYLGNTISKAKLLTSADLSGYATQTWANSKFAPLSTFKILSGYPAIVNVGNEFILTSNQSSMYVNYRTPSNTIIPTTWYWKNGTSTGYANGYWGDLYMVEKLVATQEWVSGRGYLTSITKSMVTSALGYTPPTTNTTYSQATSSTLGLVKIGATGLAAKNYAVQLNSSGQMYVAVPWTDTSSTYSAATSSTYGLVKIGATGLAAKNYAVQLNSSGQMYVSVPWTDTDTNTHYTTRLYAGASGTAANAAASNPYLKVTDDNTYRNQVRFIGAGATSISSDASGNITITSTNTTYDLSGYATQTWANSKFAPLSTFKILSGYPAIVNVGNEFILTSNQSSMYVNYRTPSNTIIPTTWYWKNGTSTGYANGYWGDLYMVEKLVATQEWVSGRGYLTSITKSMVTSALGYTPPTTNTTYSQATSSTLGLVKIGATGLAAKNYAVQLNSSGQMYVAVPWTDTSSTYSAATSSTYGLVKIGATGLAAKNYAVQLNSSGQMYVSVPWTDTDTNTHYTTRLYAGASGTAANAAASNPYLKVTDDNTYRNQVRFIGAGATSISSDASGNITITSTNTTYDLASSSSNGLMSSSQYAKLSNCIETVSAANMVTSVQVVDTIPGESSQVTGRLYLKFA